MSPSRTSRQSPYTCGVTSSDERPCMTFRYRLRQPIRHNILFSRTSSQSVGMRQGWGVAFVRAAYRRWLQLGQETGSEPNLSESLRDIRVDPQPALALAKTVEAKAALMEETDLARELGIFGSPTFVVDRELFWGDDRLEDAISWYRYGSVRSLTLLDFPEPDSLGGEQRGVHTGEVADVMERSRMNFVQTGR